MKVKRLIELLQRLPSESDVMVGASARCFNGIEDIYVAGFMGNPMGVIKQYGHRAPGMPIAKVKDDRI